MTNSPQPVPELVDAVADAAGAAIRDLHATHSEDFCVYALVTSGEGYRPYLTATVHGAERWDLADSPYAFVGDELLSRTDSVFSARGELHELSADDAEVEFGRRLASLEAALARLDDEGMFGSGEERARVLLLVATMPPDESDATFARRLNPAGPLLEAWLAEAAEGA